MYGLDGFVDSKSPAESRFLDGFVDVVRGSGLPISVTSRSGQPWLDDESDELRFEYPPLIHVGCQVELEAASWGNIDLSYRCDFVLSWILEEWIQQEIPVPKVVVEIDGRKWHDTQDRFVRDRQRDRDIYRSYGMTTLRFPHGEVMAWPDECAHMALESLAVAASMLD